MCGEKTDWGVDDLVGDISNIYDREMRPCVPGGPTSASIVCARLILAPNDPFPGFLHDLTDPHGYRAHTRAAVQHPKRLWLDKPNSHV